MIRKRRRQDLRTFESHVQPNNVAVFADTSGSVLADSGKNADTLEKKAFWGWVEGSISSQTDLMEALASAGGGVGGDIDGGMSGSTYTYEQVIDCGGA